MKKVSMFLLCLCVGLVFSSFTHKASASKIGVSIPGNYLGLVGYWTFDGKDVPNGRANDVSGNGRHGYLVNIATSTFYTSGAVGQAFNLDGANDYVNTGVNLSSFLTDGANGTYAAWAYPTADGGGNCSSLNAAPIITDGTGGGGYTTLGITFGTWCGGWWGTGVAGISAPATLYKWSHVALTVIAGVESLYVNGEFISSKTVGTTGTLSNPIYFGRSFGDVYFPGKIDEVRIYNRGLSATEIQQLYNMGR